MKIVCLNGQLGSGKDVVSDYLVNKLNGNWERTAFASAVKKIYQDTFNVDRNFIEKWKREESPPPNMAMNVRKSLQFIGDGFRQIKNDIWIEMALRDTTKQLVISDGRYINEAKAVDFKGGVNVVLFRPGYLNNDINPSESQIKPIIEWCVNNLKQSGPIVFNDNEYNPRGIEFYDYYLCNSGTLDELHHQIDELLIPFVESKFSQTAIV